MRPLIAVLALTLAGCTYATDAEIKAADKPWSDCVLREVARLDDGKSDPLTIAYGVEPACASLYAALTQTMQKGMITENAQIYMQRNMRDNELKLITSAVLNYRASHARK